VIPAVPVLDHGFEVDAGLFVAGVAGRVGSEQGPSTLPSAGDRVRVGLGTPKLTNSAGTCLIEVVNDRDRKVKYDVEHGALVVGKFRPRCRYRSRRHNQDDGFLNRRPDCRSSID